MRIIKHEIDKENDWQYLTVQHRFLGIPYKRVYASPSDEGRVGIYIMRGKGRMAIARFKLYEYKTYSNIYDIFSDYRVTNTVRQWELNHKYL